MAFSLTAKNIELRGSWLVAYVQKKNGDWTFSKLNLNEHIGNDNGQFNVNMAGWHNSALESSCRVKNSFLFAKLRNKYGSWSGDECINLDLFITNDDGKLVFKKFSDSILLSGLCFELQGTKLCGLCITPGGKFQYSEINLNDHYSNINGTFHSDDKGYAATGHSFHLEAYPAALKLVGELRNYSHNYQKAEVDLSVCIINDNGQLKFVKHDGPFDRDGDVTKFFENTPVIGLVAAGLHALAGNEEQAARALAKTTNGSIVAIGILLGAFIGGLVGCPVLGAMLGAGLASPAGILAETQIADKMITDPRVRSDIQEANIERYIFETLRNMVAAGAAEWLVGFLAKIDISQLSSFFSKVALKVVQNKGGKIATDFATYCAMKNIINALRGEQIKSWEDAEKAFEKAKAEAGAKSEVSSSTILPIEGCKYAIKIWGTNSAFTCVDNTEMRLRSYSGSSTQRFRCTYYEGHMGFICEGADGGKGRYLGYDHYETLSCQAYYQRGWEHIDVMSDELGGYKVWMKKDDHFAPIHQVNLDTVKMMATSTTRVDFIRTG